MNQIRLMISLMMVDLTLGLLVHALFLFALNIPLVVLKILMVVLTTPLVAFVAWGMDFLF